MKPSVPFWLLIGALLLSLTGGFVSIGFRAELFPWNFILVFIGLACDIAAFVAVHVLLGPSLGWKNKKFASIFHFLAPAHFPAYPHNISI
jgi:hypothetical protein